MPPRYRDERDRYRYPEYEQYLGSYRRKRMGGGGGEQERYARGRFGRSRRRRDQFESNFGPEYSENYPGARPYEPGYDTEERPDWRYTELWMVPGPMSGLGPRGYTRSDENVLADVCERLTRHGQLDAREIEVTVNDGIVTLEGTVQSRWDKRAAENTAESVPGVFDVDNRLRIRRQFGQHGGGGEREPREEPTERQTEKVEKPNLEELD